MNSLDIILCEHPNSRAYKQDVNLIPAIDDAKKKLNHWLYFFAHAILDKIRYIITGSLTSFIIRRKYDILLNKGILNNIKELFDKYSHMILVFTYLGLELDLCAGTS